MFTGRQGAEAWAELNHNPPDPTCLGVLLPKGTLAWFLIFDYDDVGYVKDDEKDRLDADQLLATLKASTERSNAYRRSKGWPDLTLTGWEYPPHYDATIKRLVWATRYQSDGQSGHELQRPRPRPRRNWPHSTLSSGCNCQAMGSRNRQRRQSGRQRVASGGRPQSSAAGALHRRWNLWSA